MLIVKNITTGFSFELDGEAGVELLKNNKFDYEVVEIDEETQKKLSLAKIPTEEQRILGVNPQSVIEPEGTPPEPIIKKKSVKKAKKKAKAAKNA